MQSPFEVSKDYPSALTPGQISPPEPDRINKSVTSHPQCKEISLTDDKSFQVSEVDDKIFHQQNSMDNGLHLGLPAHTNNEKLLKSQERTSVISEELSNKEQTPSGINRRRKKKNGQGHAQISDHQKI